MVFTPEPVGEVGRLTHQGASCLLFGGGELVTTFLAEDAVDEITVGIVPVILGRGRALFLGGHGSRLLRLVDCTIEDGKVRLFYARRAAP